jgi:hypothetical protein
MVALVQNHYGDDLVLAHITVRDDLSTLATLPKAFSMRVRDMCTYTFGGRIAHRVS